MIAQLEATLWYQLRGFSVIQPSVGNLSASDRSTEFQTFYEWFHLLQLARN